MKLQLGDIAPNFVAQTTRGTIDFHKWAGHDWVVLFSYPRNFMPVCTTELACVTNLQGEFDRRHVKAIGLSLDTLTSQLRWSREVHDALGSWLNFPMIADFEAVVATLYGMVSPGRDERRTVRTLFLIDPERRIRLTNSYPPTVGRDFDELLRVVDALQLTDQHAVSTPANWRAGRDVIITPSLNDEQARQQFPRGWRTLKPYLRLTADPKAAEVRDFELECSG